MGGGMRDSHSYRQRLLCVSLADSNREPWEGVAICTIRDRIWSEGAAILLWLLFFSVHIQYEEWYMYPTLSTINTSIYGLWPRSFHLGLISWFIWGQFGKKVCCFILMQWSEWGYRNKLSINLCMCLKLIIKFMLWPRSASMSYFPF